jgi:hypothetical protein
MATHCIDELIACRTRVTVGTDWGVKSQADSQQTTKVELIFNLKTAKSLGLVVPLPLIGRADVVIE